MMKKISTLFIFIMLGISTLYSQGAKKPKIMVVPSDALLNQKGLLSGGDDMGEEVFVQNYSKAFLDIELKAMISKFGEMMKERGFETVMLEQELKRNQGKGLSVNYDIKIDLTYKVTSQGPRKKVYAEFSGIDVYSSKQIAASSGESEYAIGESNENLLQEAVLDKIDQFNNQLMATFNEMAQNGRESRLIIISEDLSLDEEMDGKSILDFVEDWLSARCVRGNFTTDDANESRIEVSQAMMPLFGENGKSLDARNFYRDLEKMLGNIAASKGFKLSRTKSKLGEVEYTIKQN
ncbi:hypothetical protein AWR41_08805 [Riemerella anatipestifer]|uniref:DUF6175 family protein n=1 Tax=Riemerella anatipestifer TaxID=34085 RepID=UPI0004DC3BA7|nr:DUF6175 family protein [Riemerella anatipestifer]AIH02104.1 hypothetical protein M949_0935 [Riemerella anatipestifer CH3]MCW0486604.1 DUF6175 family protein [Riemerella anatipestifer]MDD1553639.1 hypothetical protein [Riemerella anatipestifer]MDD1596359.1 hypothetical protein [Riemerella anatipestifer]MDY3334738.1 DUF6175 family protein [Riemerella anatipestifer]